MTKNLRKLLGDHVETASELSKLDGFEKGLRADEERRSQVANFDDDQNIRELQCVQTKLSIVPAKRAAWLKRRIEIEESIREEVEKVVNAFQANTQRVIARTKDEIDTSLAGRIRGKDARAWAVAQALQGDDHYLAVAALSTAVYQGNYWCREGGPVFAAQQLITAHDTYLSATS